MRFVWFLVAASALAPSPAAIERQRAAAALQRESVRRQAAGLGVLAASEVVITASSSDPECEPMPESAISPIIDAAARKHDVQPQLVRAVIERESAFRPCATSAKGAQGLMQLMPGTATDLMVRDPFDPAQNVDAGTRFLKQLIDKYNGDLAQALGAYNAGPSAMDQGKAPAYPETRGYVNWILDRIGVTRTGPPSIPMPTPIEN